MESTWSSEVSVRSRQNRKNWGYSTTAVRSGLGSVCRRTKQEAHSGIRSCVGPLSYRASDCDSDSFFLALCILGSFLGHQKKTLAFMAVVACVPVAAVTVVAAAAPAASDWLMIPLGNGRLNASKRGRKEGPCTMISNPEAMEKRDYNAVRRTGRRGGWMKPERAGTQRDRPCEMCDARELSLGLFAQPETIAQKAQSTINARRHASVFCILLRETGYEERVPRQRLKINGMTSDAAMPLRPCLFAPKPPSVVAIRSTEHGALICSFLVGRWASTFFFCFSAFLLLPVSAHLLS